MNLLSALCATAGVMSLLVQWYQARPFWVDEEMIGLNLRDRALTDLGGALWLNQSAPVGWLALQYWMISGWGTAERSLRAVPVLFGIAMIVLAAATAKRWTQPLGAALLVLLCSFGPHLSYFPLETKQYSADSFVGLLFPVLTLWTLDTQVGTAGYRAKIYIWWGVATVTQWLSFAVLFLAPGYALILCAAAWWRGSAKHAVRTALPAIGFLVSFGLLYWISLRFTVANRYLQSTWRMAYPPQGAEFIDTISWLVGRLEPLGANPIGSQYWIPFWLLVCVGYYFVIRKDLLMGLVLMTAPLSAFLLAGLRLVPLADRLSLWIVPSVYLALAVVAGEAPSIVRELWTRRMRVAAVVLAACFVAATFVAFDIIRNGVLDVINRPSSKHNLDDRAAVRYLMQIRQSGDLLITSRLGLPALWWYGGINVAPPNLGREFRDSPIVRMGFRSGGPCGDDETSPALSGPRRALIYFGFDSNDPIGLHELALDTLSDHGKLFAFRTFAEAGIVAAFDLTDVPTPWFDVIAREAGYQRSNVTRPAGCIGFFSEPRW